MRHCLLYLHATTVFYINGGHNCQTLTKTPALISVTAPIKSTQGFQSFEGMLFSNSFHPVVNKRLEGRFRARERMDDREKIRTGIYDFIFFPLMPLSNFVSTILIPMIANVSFCFSPSRT